MLANVSKKVSVSTIRNAASRLFREIEQATGAEISKKSLKGTLLRLVNLDATAIDLADAPTDIQPFCGRDDEIGILTEWIEVDRCKLVALMGIGGIGKTAIAAKLGDNLAANFDFTIWKSLREAPPFSQLISELVQFLSRFTEIELPAQIDRQIGILMDYLRQHRCLLILDNLESMMEVGELAGNYRSIHRDYGELFKRLGTTPHQSCVLLTSREMPPEIIELAAPTLPVRAMFLDGLDRGAYDLLAKMGLTGDDDRLAQIVANCQGNPLYLRIIANTIFYNFQGQIDRFLSADRYSYSKITNIIRDQFERLSIAEKVIIYHLAIHREPMAIDALKIQLKPIAAIEFDLVETLVSLGKRSLIQMTRDGSYTLQNVVMEFATLEFIETLAAEIVGEGVPFFLITSPSIPPVRPNIFAMF